MRFICLGYLDEGVWNAMDEAAQTRFMNECFAYDDELKRAGHFAGGEALQSAKNAATLRYANQRVTVTDGPFAETKEQLGGILILEARDLNHAIQIMSCHPGVRAGAFEIRPSDQQCHQLAAARNPNS